MSPSSARPPTLDDARFDRSAPTPFHSGMELVFGVTQEGDGGFVAECLSHDIFTQADTWEELRQNVREAVSAFCFDQHKPAVVRLHLVRDEVLATA